MCVWMATKSNWPHQFVENHIITCSRKYSHITSHYGCVLLLTIWPGCYIPGLRFCRLRQRWALWQLHLAMTTFIAWKGDHIWSIHLVKDELLTISGNHNWFYSNTFLSWNVWIRENMLFYVLVARHIYTHITPRFFKLKEPCKYCRVVFTAMYVWKDSKVHGIRHFGSCGGHVMIWVISRLSEPLAMPVSV